MPQKENNGMVLIQRQTWNKMRGERLKIFQMTFLSRNENGP
jgi:hypothetical protein